jgi:MYXO-CTERM domain-containing protein
VRVSNNDKANQGAPEAAFHGGGQYTVGYYESGAQTYIVGVKMEADGTLNKTFNEQVVITPSNIGRPAIATKGDRTLLCAAKGDQRPPEDGVACAFINSIDGTVYWKNEVIAASAPANNVYMNQPSLASLGDGRFVLHAIESTGQGKNTNTKGGSKAHLYVLEPTDAGPNVRAHTSGIGAYQTHSAVFAGPYGEAGETFIGFFEAPITGSGSPSITFLKYDSVGQKFEDPDYDRNQWIVGTGNADSGYLANLYGANPGTQGRDYMRGIAGVPNPGAGVEGGFMKEVKSFFVLPYAGMKKGEEKNALFLSFVPGQTLVPAVAGPPTPVEPAPPARPTPAAGADPTQSTGCACVVGASSSQEGTVAGVAALGLALIVVTRRRKVG